jgi:hypothetical protein
VLSNAKCKDEDGEDQEACAGKTKPKPASIINHAKEVGAHGAVVTVFQANFKWHIEGKAILIQSTK